MIDVYKITEKKDILKFIDFAWDIYKEDENFVPPLKHDLLNTLSGRNNPLFSNGPHTFFIVKRKEKIVGRVIAGINEKLNSEKCKKEGYLSLFEAYNDREAVNALLDSAFEWLYSRGAETVIGPVSPTGGDDYRGFLVKGFDGSPVLMNSYNPAYYSDLFELYGFRKDMDLYAFYLDPPSLAEKRYSKVIEYAMKKFKFRIDKFDKNYLDREIKDIKFILDHAMPESWEHLTPPSYEEIRKEINQLIKFMDADFVYIARTDDGRPIGFIAALPDFNQVLKKMNGRLLPFGFIKYLWYKRKITGVRIFTQFVIPEYRNKGVNNAIYYKLMQEGRRKGIKYGEGSCIAEMNTESIRNVEGVGGKLYRIYRIYRKDIQSAE